MRITFVDHSTKLESVTDLETRARGGMVSSLFEVTDYLAKRGHEVIVSSDIKTEGVTRAGVEWVNRIPLHLQDVCVLNRGINDGWPEIRAKRRVLWTHDLPHGGFAEDPRLFRGLSAIVHMSAYSERIWTDYYRDLRGVKVARIPNGVRKGWFRPTLKRDRKLLVFGSAPNRGLRHLPFLAECILERHPDARVVAYSNLAKMHPGEVRDGDRFDGVYREVQESTVVEMRDPVPQEEWAGVLSGAGVLLLPSDYPEICSNVVLQALSCGVPVIATGRLGATPEWVRHDRNGYLTDWMPHDYMVYKVDFLRQVMKALDSPEMYDRLVWGALRTKVMSWEEVGDQWHRLLS